MQFLSYTGWLVAAPVMRGLNGTACLQAQMEKPTISPVLSCRINFNEWALERLPLGVPRSATILYAPSGVVGSQLVAVATVVALTTLAMLPVTEGSLILTTGFSPEATGADMHEPMSFLPHPFHDSPSTCRTPQCESPCFQYTRH